MSHTTMTRRQFVAGMLASCGAAVTAGLLTACGQQASGTAASTSASVRTAAASNPAATSQTGSGRVLVAYYSAQGHTKAAAEAAADALGADLFEIVPAEPYTDDDLDWRDEGSRVVREHDDASLQTIELAQATPEGWDSYGTVLLGYPIWWGIAAWPTNGFVSGNDFASKNVVPFCTSASSSLGESATNLAALDAAGNWQQGIRFSSGVDASEVASWATALSL